MIARFFVSFLLFSYDKFFTKIVYIFYCAKKKEKINSDTHLEKKIFIIYGYFFYFLFVF
jgi:hypothetical protein